MQTDEQKQDASALKRLAPAPEWENLTAAERDQYRKRWQEEDSIKVGREIQEHAQKKLLEDWNRLCPEIYRDEIDLNKIEGDRAKAALIMRWEYQPTGMVVTGPTGHGKTRTVWHALKRAHYAGHWIKALDGIQFANDASAAAYSPDKTEAWLARLSAPTILFIDDLAKRFTATSGPLLFALVERRVTRRMPIIITTNLSADQLKTLINDPQLSEPLVRRLREFCNPILL